MPLRERYKRLKRWLKYKYIQLLRAKGGPSKVAMGFSIGLAIEMFTLPTFGLAALLIIPAVYLLRGSLPAALIGFLFGKIIYLPMAFLNRKVGSWIVPDNLLDGVRFHHAHWLNHVIRLLDQAMTLIVGGMIVGAVLGLIAYFPIRKLLQIYMHRRLEKRYHRKRTQEQQQQQQPQDPTPPISSE
ncbi:DUF2062 domain-containing protein [Tumebacillus flagellatus]|uniref:DUF2062 domain-containing protein n=1 Tax=Tumebacillus flagellatus TaxID=1157490 RepID=A0A074LI49_9BACL|nr:DUF2062 domain-containing protein [Tumebacillus flagellatus]KEO81901.1 hypothetical protein EL26_18885 [Tumebacillus flagellatus]